jgi:ubiquinone/menaquinone biosynthesis C-methylase UbiE
MVHDLENLPWPFHDNWFYVVYALQILEHLEERVKTMEEIWRVCQDGALVFIQVPNGSCPGYDQDPTHKHPWNLGTFLYFCPTQWPKNWNEQGWSPKAKFRILHYDVTHEAGRTPWGATTFGDNLTVILQAIKESGK